MEWRRGLREVLQSVRAHTVTAALLALVAAIMSAAVFASAGRAAMTEREVMASTESTAPRLIAVNIQAQAPGYSADTVAILNSLNTVDWLIALGPVTDVGNPAVPSSRSLARSLLTPLPPEVTIIQGRYPGAGEALLSNPTMNSLSYILPARTLEAESQYAIVGSYSATGSLKDLERLVLLGPAGNDPPDACQIYIAAIDIESVSLLTSQILALSTPEQANHVTIDTSDELVLVTQTISGELGSFSRQLSAGILLGGTILIGLTSAIASLGRRRNYGRRRALGATRSAIIALALGENAVPVIAGASLGTALAVTLIGFLAGVTAHVGLIIAVPVLVSLAGIAATVPSAIWVAMKDPVSVLRIP